MQLEDLSKDDLIGMIAKQDEFLREERHINVLLLTQVEQLRKETEIPAQTGMPFLYAIMAPDGHAHIDECCVAGSPDGLYPELNCLNDSPDTGYTIIPLYTSMPDTVAIPLVEFKDEQPARLETKEELHSRATMAAVAWLMAESNGRHDPRSMHDVVKGVFAEHIDKWRAARFPELADYVESSQPVSGAALVGYVDADAVAQAKGGKDAKVTIYTLPRLAAGLDVAIYTAPLANVAQVGELSGIKALDFDEVFDTIRSYGFTTSAQSHDIARAIIAAMSAPANTDKG